MECSNCAVVIRKSSRFESRLLELDVLGGTSCFVRVLAGESSAFDGREGEEEGTKKEYAPAAESASTSTQSKYLNWGKIDPFQPSRSFHGSTPNLAESVLPPAVNWSVSVQCSRT